MNPFTGRVARATLVTLILLVAAPASQAQTRVRVGTCARTLTAGVGSQFAVASKMGWFAQEGLDVEVVPLTGSTDCVKFVATREFLMTLPSMEPLAIGRLQGVKIKNFYTAYQTPGYAIAVPADSPIQKLSDLKGKTIGVTNMASAGVVIARARETVSAVRLGRREARELGCPTGAPAFESERVSYDAAGAPVVFDRVFIPGDRFRITRELHYEGATS